VRFMDKTFAVVIITLILSVSAVLLLSSGRFIL
jgi:hypothetical protein